LRKYASGRARKAATIFHAVYPEIPRDGSNGGPAVDKRPAAIQLQDTILDDAYFLSPPRLGSFTLHRVAPHL